MSNKERVTELLKELREDLTQLRGTNSIPNPVEKLVAATKEAFNKMDPDDKKTLKKRYETTISQFRQRREKLGGKKFDKKAKGGSISKLKAGGFPDLSGDGKVTQKDILMGRGVVKKQRGGEVNGLKKMGMKVGGLAGRLAQRGYGKARR